MDVSGFSICKRCKGFGEYDCQLSARRCILVAGGLCSRPVDGRLGNFLILLGYLYLGKAGAALCDRGGLTRRLNLSGNAVSECVGRTVRGNCMGESGGKVRLLERSVFLVASRDRLTVVGGLCPRVVASRSLRENCVTWCVTGPWMALTTFVFNTRPRPCVFPVLAF